MGVSKNRGTPKSSILIGFSHYKPSILVYPYCWKHPSYGSLWDPYGVPPDLRFRCVPGTGMKLIILETVALSVMETGTENRTKVSNMYPRGGIT